MALFAALTRVRLQSGTMPFAHVINATFGTDDHEFGWTIAAFAAIILTLGVVVILAMIIERVVLKHLVNQEPVILFIATIGLAYFLEGFGDLMWGSDIKAINLSIGGVALPQGGNQWSDGATEGWAEGFYGVYLDNLAISATVVEL